MDTRSDLGWTTSKPLFSKMWVKRKGMVDTEATHNLKALAID